MIEISKVVNKSAVGTYCETTRTNPYIMYTDPHSSRYCTDTGPLHAVLHVVLVKYFYIHIRILDRVRSAELDPVV